MTQHQAIEILVQAARVANKRGAFELEESEQISQAVKLFTTPQDQEVNNGTEETDKQ